MNDDRPCPECQSTSVFLNVVTDAYGIYYRRVCDDCYDAVCASIRGWRFDPADAGESLEPDDY